MIGTSLASTGESAEDGGFGSLWGRGAITSFDGHEGDLTRPREAITRRDVKARIRRLTEEHGRKVANHTISLQRSTCRRHCVVHDEPCNPVEQWLAGGGR